MVVRCLKAPCAFLYKKEPEIFEEMDNFNIKQEGASYNILYLHNIERSYFMIFKGFWKSSGTQLNIKKPLMLAGGTAGTEKGRWAMLKFNLENKMSFYESVFTERN